MNPIEALMETATPLQRKLLEGCKWVPETGCWEWVGGKMMRLNVPVSEYGVHYFNTRVLAFEEFIGPLNFLDKPYVNCKNKRCVSPTHLVPKELKPLGYWTKETCAIEALKYATRSDFQKYSTSAYQSASREGYIDEICSHMIVRNGEKPDGYWTKENCHSEALKYSRRVDFINGCSPAHASAARNGWLDEVCSHMREIRKPDGYWTKTLCAEEALNYKTRGEFKQTNGSAYHAAVRNGWIATICDHMIEVQKPKGYWTIDRCQKEAMMYETRAAFMRGSSGAYKASHRNGWLDEICGHMTYAQKPNGYWTIDRCREEARKYTTRKDFMNGSPAYSVAHKRGWIDDICNHMVRPPVGRNKKYTVDNCREKANICSDRSDFKKRFYPFYDASVRNKWLDEFFPKKPT